MNRPSVLLFLLLFVIGVSGFAQSIDSLQNLIQLEKNGSQKALLFREISYKYLNLQQLDSCLKYARLGKELAKKNGDRFGEAYNYEMEGNYYYYKGLHESAMNVFTQILQLNECIKDAELAARAYSMMGWIYMEQRQFDNAKEVFYKALPILKSKQGADEDLALAYYGIASVYSYRHSHIRNPRQGKLYYDSALRVSPGLQVRERAFALAELGAVIRENTRNYNQSLRLMLDAEKLIQKDTSHRDTYAYVLAEMAYTYALMRQDQKAKEKALQSLLLYNQVPLYSRIPSVYQLLTETFEMINDISMAYQTEKQNRALSDSLFSNRNVLLVEQIHAQYEDERKQAEINRLSKANALNELTASNNRNIAIAISISSVIILVMMAWISASRSRYKKKIDDLKFKQSLREEKDRISRELHDSLGGQLSAISIGLSQLNHEPNDKVLHLQELADRAFVELRNALWIMDKDFVSMTELEQQINELLWQYRKLEVSVQLQLRVDESLAAYQLPALKGGHLVRIIQEAVHNGIKHSQANMLKIVFEKSDTQMQVLISDNGVGFNSLLQPDGHYGLRNMKWRAQQMQALFQVESAIGKGVTIRISVPLA